jgi:hypothetical protein
MNNFRAKYPTIQQIVLQPVVGGPGGSQCCFNGRVMRATYNFRISPVLVSLGCPGMANANATLQ